MLLKDANQVLAVLKHNVTQTRQILASWAVPQPFDRKEGKVRPSRASFQILQQGWYRDCTRQSSLHQWLPYELPTPRATEPFSTLAGLLACRLDCANQALHLRCLNQQQPWLQVYNQTELQAAFTEGLAARGQLIADGGSKIAALLAESQTTVKTARASPEWRAYTEFVAGIVIDGLAAAAVAGLAYIRNQASPGQQAACMVAEAAHPMAPQSEGRHSCLSVSLILCACCRHHAYNSRPCPVC